MRLVEVFYCICVNMEMSEIWDQPFCMRNQQKHISPTKSKGTMLKGVFCCNVSCGLKLWIVNFSVYSG